MDLKDFQNVNDDAVDTSKATAKDATKTRAKAPLVDAAFHDESDQIIKDLETRIAALNNEDKKNEKHDSGIDDDHSGINNQNHEEENLAEGSPLEIEGQNEEVVEVEEGRTFVEKIQPFILPIFLTIFALIFAAIFLYFFSKSRIEKSVIAIQNQQSQPEVIIVKETKPEVKEDVIIPEKTVPECDPETEQLNEAGDNCEDLPPPEKAGFENGTTTVIKVRFAYDKLNYDNYPRGIYLLSDQVFEGEYEDYKLLATNRPFANDMFFGVNRQMVSLLGACQFVVDEADILVENVRDSEGDQVYSAIKDKYFRGKMLKIIESSKPHIVCGK